MYTASGSEDGQGARLKGRARLPETKPHTGRQTNTSKPQYTNIQREAKPVGKSGNGIARSMI